MLISFALLLLLASVNAENSYGSYSLGCYGAYQYRNDLELSKLQGLWYIQYIYIDGTIYGCTGCYTGYWALLDPDHLFLNGCCRQENTTVPFCSAYLGSGVVSQQAGSPPGVYTYDIAGNIFVGSFLEVDYANYLTALVCGPDDKQWFYLLTRVPNLPANADTQYREYLKALRARDYPSRVVHDAQCVYTTGCGATTNWDGTIPKPSCVL